MNSLFTSVLLSFSKLHGKTNRTYQGTDSNASYNENGDYHSVKSLNLALESNKSPTCSSSRSNIRDKNAYLKSLERSLRTGRRIQDEEDNDNDNHSNNQSRLNLFNFICNFINKHIRRRATHPNESMEL